MTPQEVIDQFRREMGDEELPYLISDEEALNYLVQAQDDMVRASGGIADASSAITSVAVVTGEAFADLSPYILRIRSARLTTADRDLTIINEADLATQATWSYGRRIPLTLNDDEGVVDFGILGLEENQVRWYKVPADDDTCTMHVLRLPYPRLTITTLQDGTVSLEVPVEQHMNLVLGMRARAYLKQDAEVYDKGQADRFEAMFARACDQARKDTERRRYRPRTVQFGGI